MTHIKKQLPLVAPPSAPDGQPRLAPACTMANLRAHGTFSRCMQLALDLSESWLRFSAISSAKTQLADSVVSTALTVVVAAYPLPRFECGTKAVTQSLRNTNDKRLPVPTSAPTDCIPAFTMSVCCFINLFYHLVLVFIEQPFATMPFQKLNCL